MAMPFVLMKHVGIHCVASMGRENLCVSHLAPSRDVRRRKILNLLFVDGG